MRCPDCGTRLYVSTTESVAEGIKRYYTCKLAGCGYHTVQVEIPQEEYHRLKYIETQAHTASAEIRDHLDRLAV